LSSPTLTLAPLTGLDPLPDEIVLSWTADDPDPQDEPEDLYFDVFFTPDGGQTLQVLAVDLKNTTTLTVRTANLPGSNEARFIVRANDMWNRTVAQTGPFVIPDREPIISIRRPRGSDDIVEGETLPMLAIAL